MSATEIWVQLAEYWRQNDCAACPGVSTAAITDFEERHHVVMPPDVQAYFFSMNGQCWGTAGRSGIGNDLFRFWSLEETELWSEAYTEGFAIPNCFVFADYSIECWVYAVDMGSASPTAGAVYQIDGKYNLQVSSSFSKFIQAYMADPLSIMA